MRAHATQIDPAEAWWFGLDDDELNAVWPWEDWVLARSLVGPIPAAGAEDDLFAGVRSRRQEQAWNAGGRSATSEPRWVRGAAPRGTA